MLFAKAEIRSRGLEGRYCNRPAGGFLDATVRYVLRSKFGLFLIATVEIVTHRRTLSGLQRSKGRGRCGGMSIPHCSLRVKPA